MPQPPIQPPATDGARPVVLYRRPPLKPYQLSAIFDSARFAFIEATTKGGKTYGCLAWLAEQAFLTRKLHGNFSWMAPVYQQAKIAYRRLRRYIPAALREPNDTELTLTLPNTSRINFFSGEKPDNLYGDDDEASVIDEASRTREEARNAMLSRLTATRGPMRCIGNVKGRKNWFYQEARKAEAGEPNTHYARITWQDAVAAGVLHADSIEDARRRLPEAVFRELFDATPNDDGGNPFGLPYIASCVGVLSLARAVCYGVDLAKSHDWTVIVGLDWRGRVCHFERFQKPWKETKERIREVCGSTYTLVDSTGVGDPVLEDLQRDEKFHGRFEGFKFSRSSKQQIVEGLAVAIQQKKTEFPDGVLRLELESFEYEYVRNGVFYSAPPGMHDDSVYALALAWSIFQEKGMHHAASSWGGGVPGLQPPAPEWE
jgi:hypothetical protein